MKFDGTLIGRDTCPVLGALLSWVEILAIQKKISARTTAEQPP